jgi:GNAT superfamily N-acetyltransferase
VNEGPAAGHPAAVEFIARDGAPIMVRPILPEDKGRLRDGFERLSSTSRLRRFMAPVSELSEDQLRYLTEIDYRDHMAWVALDPTTPGRPGMGVARYVRLAHDPAAAEAAVTVVDEHQGRGIGTILLGMLALSARKVGIRTFRAYVLDENRPMLEILLDLGATIRHKDAGVVEVDVPISADPEDLPDTPAGRTFRAVARRQVPPFTLASRRLF